MSKINLLVVDDRPEGLLAVEAVLSSSQYNIVTASSGSDALKRLLEMDFAVILLDVQMPIMNGFETAAVIKTREKSKDVPIIFMSAINQDEHYVYQGYGVGAVDYLLKPFDPYILKSKVAIFADLYRLNQKIKEQAQRLHENDIKIYTQALDKLELESLKKYQYLADAIPQIVFRLLPDGTHSYFNKVWFEFTGLTDGEASGVGWKNVIHPDDLPSLLGLFTDNKVGGHEAECRIRNREGIYRWHLIRMEPEIYSDPKFVKTWLGTATDIEERKRHEEAQLFLAQAGEFLISTLDFESNLKELLRMAVPRMADFTEMALLDGEGELVPKGDGPSLESGGTRLLIPLWVHGECIGRLTFGYGDSGRKYGASDLGLAKELAGRIAMGFENSRLYRISQEAIEIRNDFLSIASHELNTPITSLKLQLQMVLRGLQNAQNGQIPFERFTNSVNSSVRQVNRLIGLIQVLLDVSRIQSGKFTFSFAEFTLKDVVKEVVERHQEIIENGECQLELSEIPDVEVRWDKTRIEQVITNLMVNAIKYAPGKIELKVEARGNEVTFKVIDHGIGIEPEKLSGIFNRFERASTSETVGGLGLGLFIVKQIVEGHKGRIEVESQQDSGTCFTVTLPVDAAFSSSWGSGQEQRPWSLEGPISGY